MRYRHTDVPSLLQGDMPYGEEECYICHKPHCDFHHLLSGNKYKRRFAESVGAWIWLCRGHHSYVHDTADGQKKWDEWKEQAQTEFEKNHTREEWMRGCHRNYRT